MKKFVLSGLLYACQAPSQGDGLDQTQPSTGDDTAMTLDTSDTPTDTGDTTDTSWVEQPCDVAMPLVLDLFHHQSPNGEFWSDPTWLRGMVSVPEVVVDEELTGGDARLFWMAFEDRSDQCDHIVESTFDPLTGEQGEPSTVHFKGLPELALLDQGYSVPLSDPEIMNIGGRAVMVSTIWPASEAMQCVGVLVAREGEDFGGFTFDFASHLLWCNEDQTFGYTDPVVIWVPEDATDPASSGVIRVWMASAMAMLDGTVDNREWEVAVPDPADVSTWYESDRHPSTLTLFHTLGSIDHTDEEDCPYVAWGSFDTWVHRACSSDLVNWVEAGQPDPRAADPVVVRWEDEWQMFVTREETYTGE